MIYPLFNKIYTPQNFLQKKHFPLKWSPSSSYVFSCPSPSPYQPIGGSVKVPGSSPKTPKCSPSFRRLFSENKGNALCLSSDRIIAKDSQVLAKMKKAYKGSIPVKFVECPTYLAEYTANLAAKALEQAVKEATKKLQSGAKGLAAQMAATIIKKAAMDKLSHGGLSKKIPPPGLASKPSPVKKAPLSKAEQDKLAEAEKKQKDFVEKIRLDRSKYPPGYVKPVKQAPAPLSKEAAAKLAESEKKSKAWIEKTRLDRQKKPQDPPVPKEVLAKRAIEQCWAEVSKLIDNSKCSAK